MKTPYQLRPPPPFTIIPPVNTSTQFVLSSRLVLWPRSPLHEPSDSPTLKFYLLSRARSDVSLPLPLSSFIHPHHQTKPLPTPDLFFLPRLGLVPRSPTHNFPLPTSLHSLFPSSACSLAPEYNHQTFHVHFSCRSSNAVISESEVLVFYTYR